MSEDSNSAAMIEPFADRLLAWAAVYGRHDLPWQRERTAYRVWVSEIMLQQTQVGTVVPYFERFLQRFADIRTLASAPQDEVLHYWSGLGYYARARNLHAAARLIEAKHGGRFPEQIDQVHALPGVGRSTAGAILTLACGQRHAIMDGNVKRVLTRHRCIAGWPGEPKVERSLWELAESLTPEVDRAAAYTQAIMDLGAMVCRRTKPLCGGCPVSADCAALAAGAQEQYPHKRPRKAQPVKAVRMLMILREDDDSVLLEHRPPAGIWGGLWSFPEVALETDPSEWISAQLRATVRGSRQWDVVRHMFSHYQLDIHPLAVRVSAPAGGVLEAAGRVWYNVADLPQIGLAAPVEKLLGALADPATRAF